MDTKFSLKYKQLGDSNWLKEKYCEQKLSFSEIANLLGCKWHSVRSACLRHEIPIRTRGEGLRNARRFGEDYFIFNSSVLNGCLLGDGGLSCQNKESDDSFPVLTVSTIHYDHAIWLANQLFSKNPESRVKERRNHGFFNPKGNIFRVTTITHESLVPVFKSWYPKSNNFNKIIPEDIEIDEKMLLHWYLGDGYSYIVNNKKCKNPYRVRVQFATQSFSKNELEMFCEMVKSKFGLKLYPRLHQRHGKIKGTGYHVELSESIDQVSLFFDIIGHPPVASLSYKWKLLQS